MATVIATMATTTKDKTMMEYAYCDHGNNHEGYNYDDYGYCDNGNNSW